MTRLAMLVVWPLCLTAPALAESSPRPLLETLRSFEQRGYDVRSAENDGRTYEIEAIAPDGRRIEALVEAATGEVLAEHPDD